MRRKSSTLDDLEGHWQPVRSAILATAGFLVLKLTTPLWMCFGVCSVLIVEWDARFRTAAVASVPTRPPRSKHRSPQFAHDHDRSTALWRSCPLLTIGVDDRHNKTTPKRPRPRPVLKRKSVWSRTVKFNVAKGSLWCTAATKDLSVEHGNTKRLSWLQIVQSTNDRSPLWIGTLSQFRRLKFSSSHVATLFTRWSWLDEPTRCSVSYTHLTLPTKRIV